MPEAEDDPLKAEKERQQAEQDLLRKIYALQEESGLNDTISALLEREEGQGAEIGKGRIKAFKKKAKKRARRGLLE